MRQNTLCEQCLLCSTCHWSVKGKLATWEEKAGSLVSLGSRWTLIKECPILLSLIKSCWSLDSVGVSQHHTAGRVELFPPGAP